MDTSQHTMSALFQQLGLGFDDNMIERFIDANRGINASVQLADAEFWSHSQANFIREALSQDSDWSEIVDQLDCLLRK